MKKYIFILTLFFPVLFYGQRVHKHYYSYPDRFFEIQIDDTYVFLITTEDKDSYTQYYYEKKGNMLYLTEKGRNKIKYVLYVKGRYIDWIYDIRDKEGCGRIYKKKSILFTLKQKYIIKKTSRESYLLRVNLIARLKRLKVFKKSCDSILPEIINETF